MNPSGQGEKNRGHIVRPTAASTPRGDDPDKRKHALVHRREDGGEGVVVFVVHPKLLARLVCFGGGWDVQV